MNSYTTENEIIASCLKELKLPAIKDLLEDTITDAKNRTGASESSFAPC